MLRKLIGIIIVCLPLSGGELLAQAGDSAASPSRSSAKASNKVSAKAPVSGKSRRFNYRRHIERLGYKRVSSLVNFPTFFPGIGILYVRPETLPNGPFISLDRKDRLISTIYMIPMEDMEKHKTIDLSGFRGRGDHTTFHFNPGHPGVDMPHYHVMIWHVSKKNEALVK